jgi:hypothetical protein
MTSGEPHSEARAKTADWRYAVDRARRSVRMISRGRRKLGVVEARWGRRKGRTGKVVRRQTMRRSRRAEWSRGDGGVWVMSKSWSLHKLWRHTLPTPRWAAPRKNRLLKQYAVDNQLARLILVPDSSGKKFANSGIVQISTVRLL